MNPRHFFYTFFLILFNCLILIPSFPVFGQHGDTVFSSNGRIEFEYISIDDGLSQSTVNCILQDRAGFLWFGTEDGLNRYDGYNFRVFKPDSDENKSINHNYVWSLFEDHLGMIWIGTNGGGLNRFNRVTEDYSAYKFNPENPLGLSNNFIRVIFEDQKGYLWVGTEGGGLNRSDNTVDHMGRDSDLRFRHYHHAEGASTALSNNFVRSIYRKVIFYIDKLVQLW